MFRFKIKLVLEIKKVGEEAESEVHSVIKNPILKGFNPDPCICRKGDDYYAAVSSFEWFPGIPVYHSRDLKNWELYTHILKDDEEEIAFGKRNLGALSYIL